MEFTRPYERTRDVLAFLREALTGARVDRSYETFAVEGFRLRLVPKEPPPLLLAALRPRMLRLAGSSADGAITNWLSADDVPRVREAVVADSHLVARILVCPTTDADLVPMLVSSSGV